MALGMTLLTGTAGGLVAWVAHVPLGLLLGSLIAVGFLAATNRRIAGHAMYLPATLRMCFVPIIGVAIGGAFTPDIVQQAAAWWPSLLALLIYLPLLHWVGYQTYLRAGFTKQTAFYGAVPGGLIEMSLIALSLQISTVYVAAHHVARIILAVAIAQVAGPRA